MWLKLLLVSTLTCSFTSVFATNSYAPETHRSYLQPQKNEYTQLRKRILRASLRYDVPYKFLLSIWQEESRSKVWVPEGRDGELSPFQIMPATAKYYKCSAKWSTKDAPLCAAKIISRFKCRSWLRKAAKYNTGRCGRVNAYARSVYRRFERMR